MSEITHVPSDLLASPTFQLERLRRRTRDFVETALAKQGFNLRQYWALTCLVDGDASSQATLGDILHIDRSDMVRLVDSLEEHALAERMRDPNDRRRQIISVTKKGRRAHAGLADLVQQAEEDALNASTPKQLRQLVKLAEVIMDSAKNLESADSTV